MIRQPPGPGFVSLRATAADPAYMLRPGRTTALGQGSGNGCSATPAGRSGPPYS